MSQGPGSTRSNKGPFVVGGFYNAAPFTLVDGQSCSFQFDVNGNLKVTSTGGGGGSNPAAGPTGAPVPSDADFLGISIGGILEGVTGFAVGPSVGIAVAIIDGSGNQVSSFGGGVQYDDGVTQATPTGTVALGKNPSNVLHALALDASGNLLVDISNTSLSVTQGTSPWVISFSAPQHVIVDSGSISVTQGTSPWVISFTAPQHVIVDSGSVSVTGTVGVTQSTSPWVISFTAPQHVIVDSGTLSVTQGTSPWVISFTAPQHVIVDSGSVSITGTVGVTQSTSPWVISFTAPQHVIVDSGTLSVTQGTSPWVISFTAPQHVIVDSGAVTVSGSVSITGTVGVTQSTSPWVISFTAPQHIIIDSGTTVVTQGTSPWVVAGNLTHNNAAPAGANVGVLPAVANTQPPVLTTADQVLLSTDLAGNLRVANQSIQKIVQKAGGASTGSVATLAQAFGSNNIVGNSIVVVLAVGNGNGPTVSDSNGNVYVQANGTTNGTAFGAYIFLATGIAAGANTVTVTNGGANASMAMEIYEVQGILTTSYTARSADKSLPSGTGTSNSASSAAFSPLSGNEIAFSGVAVGTAAQTITPVSFVNDSGQLNPVTPAGLFSFVSMSSYITAVGQVVTPTASLAGSEPWAVVGATFLPYLQPIQGTVLSRVVGNLGLTLDAALNTGAAPLSGLWVQPAPSVASAAALTPTQVTSTGPILLKASSGNLYGVWLVNLATTTGVGGVHYVHFFNTTTTTGLTAGSEVLRLAISSPTIAAAGGPPPLSIPPGAMALANFSLGIVIVVNTTNGQNTASSGVAPAGVIWVE